MKKYVQLTIGVITMLFMGVAYAWSLFVDPLESEFNWTRNQTSLVFTISMVCFCVGGIAGSFINRKIGYIKTIGIALTVICAGLSRCANVEELWQIYLFYGFLCGGSIGILYNTVISTINTWFGDKIGFSSGTLMMGYGLGSFFLGTVISYTNNQFGWRTTFYILASSFFVLLVLNILITRKNLSGKEKNKDNRELNVQYTPKEVLRTRKFYLYYFWGTSVTAVGLSVIGHASQFAGGIGADTALIVFMTGAFSVSNGLSRIITGLLYDHIGRRFTMMILTIVLLTGLFALLGALYMESSVIMLLAFFLTGFGYGGGPPCHSTFAKECYGSKYYGENFSILTSSGIPAAITGPYMVGVISTYMGSYVISCTYLLFFAASALIVQSMLK